MRRDWIAGLILFGLAVCYYMLATEIPKSQLSDAVGAASFPKLLAIFLAILSALLFLSGLVRQKRSSVPAEQKTEQANKERQGFLRAGGTLLLGVGFILILDWVGYIVAVALLLGGMILYNHMKLTWRSGIVAVAGGVVFWLLFRFAFNIPVPAGIWPKIFGI